MHIPDLGSHTWEWVAYFAGAGSGLIYKYLAALYAGYKQGKQSLQTTLEWFFEGSSENRASWTATIGFVWIIGGVYLGGIEWSVIGLEQLPVHVGIAFFLGAVMEMTAPTATKWFISKMPWPWEKKEG